MYRVTIESDEDVSVGIRSEESDSQAMYNAAGSGGLIRDTWVKLCVIIDLTEGKIRIYIDGVEYGSQNISLNLTTFDDTVVHKWLGQRPDSSYPFYGEIRSMLHFTTALNPTQIAKISSSVFQPVPQKTIFLPLGGDVILPINTPINLAGEPGLTSILWTWESGA
jgi:hypothetical protein